MNAILIAGTTSGVGKTTVATGLMGALSRRGLKVQPFKTGPDYIDPGYHASATGEISRNLDTWLFSRETVLELFGRAVRGKDIAVIEGVMGLYDGRAAIGDEGSTAELARILDIPILLILNSSKGARSLAAMVAGYHDFDARINIAGVILNGIGSDHHYVLCKEAIQYYTRVPVVGYLPMRSDLSIQERHLGLVSTAEYPTSCCFLDSLISQCEETIDIDAILSISRRVNVLETVQRLFPATIMPKVAKIAIARDKAFSFYYQDSVDLLEAWGAEIVYFSPTSDSELPNNISGLYIGGGFPEIYGQELADNQSMLNSIRLAAQAGISIYAECGGLIYLAHTMTDLKGNKHAMAGLIPIDVRIDRPALNLGYRTVRALEDNLLLRKGETVRGHEFHWSVLADDSVMANAYEIVETECREGFLMSNILASYIHIHMASKLSMAQRFIEICRSTGNSSY